MYFKEDLPTGEYIESSSIDPLSLDPTYEDEYWF